MKIDERWKNNISQFYFGFEANSQIVSKIDSPKFIGITSLIIVNITSFTQTCLKTMFRCYSYHNLI